MRTPSRLRPGSLLARVGQHARIAVLRTGRLGDLLVLTPALRSLRRAIPDAQVTLLVNDRAIPLATRLRTVDEVVRVPELSAMEQLRDGSPDADMQHLLEDLRSKQFHVALQCAGGGETTNPFVLALGARVSAGHEWPDSPRLDLRLPYQRNQPDVLRHLDLMELIGVPPGPLEYDLPITDADLAELRALPAPALDALNSRRLVVVAAGAGSGARCWPTERFAEVIDRLVSMQADLRVALTGTSEEAPRVGQVIRGLPSGERVYNLAGQLSLGGLLALIKGAALFIGNDSAPAHFATALSTPSVVVFGSAHPAQWAAPARLWHRAVADETAPCRRFQPPCGCPDDATAVCISSVSVADVLGQVQAVLELVSAGKTGSTHGASHARSTTVVGRS